MTRYKLCFDPGCALVSLLTAVWVRKSSYVVGNGRSSFVVLAPNMSSSPVLENGGGAQKRKQQSRPHDRVFSPRDFTVFVALPYCTTLAHMCFCSNCWEWCVALKSKWWLWTDASCVPDPHCMLQLYTVYTYSWQAGLAVCIHVDGRLELAHISWICCVLGIIC